MVKILLDNGHGYDTPGKRSPIWPDGSQLFEWEFNRDIVSRIEILLKKAGISCVRLVAEIFRDLWKNHFPELRFRGCKEENFCILRESVCPALLTENLFMDNYEDCKILLSECGREKIARWHAESIQTILRRFYQLG